MLIIFSSVNYIHTVVQNALFQVGSGPGSGPPESLSSASLSTSVNGSRLTSASQAVLRIKRKRILKHLLTIERCVRRIMGVLPMQLV